MGVTGAGPAVTRQTGIRAELLELKEFGAGSRLRDDEALAHVEVTAKLVELAALLAN